MRLLDTNILSEIVRVAPNPGVVAELSKRHSRLVFASAVTRYELRYGAGLRPNAQHFWARLSRQILPLVTWLAVTPTIAERGGAIRASLRRQGRECGALDPLLAATALEYGLILVTRNVRHFAPVPRLKVENWFS
jgi:predicted nucleic acid-binding protein